MSMNSEGLHLAPLDVGRGLTARFLVAWALFSGLVFVFWLAVR